ncbi:hypothetical protein Naga_101682g1 [Nannochloropsis gaditana]|uniref:Non-haem dioxygenase N-terminal domain-containing protein n=1 Tax=Nannochloropsis gaditana TaxID=72520 RepID=W7TMK6_9STRA|nr:hypothetical protein Naga_101682g1 [Nannochloropsis gaditana]
MDCQRHEDLSPSSNFLTSSSQPPSSPSSPSTPSYIPIISLSPLHDQSVEGKQAVAQAIRKACEDIGFFHHHPPQCRSLDDFRGFSRCNGVF